MAHSLSSKKRIRQNEKQRMLNRGRRSTLKNILKDCVETMAGGDANASESKVREICAQLDREANRGLIHRNEAARRKSALALKLNAMKSKTA